MSKEKMVVGFINDEDRLELCLKPDPSCLSIWIHLLVKESDLDD